MSGLPGFGRPPMGPPSSRWKRGLPRSGANAGLVTEVAREVHGGHAAAADLALDYVAVTELLRQSGFDWRHELAGVGATRNVLESPEDRQPAAYNGR